MPLVASIGRRSNNGGLGDDPGSGFRALCSKYAAPADHSEHDSSAMPCNRRCLTVASRDQETQSGLLAGEDSHGHHLIGLHHSLFDECVSAVLCQLSTVLQLRSAAPFNPLPAATLRAC